MLRTILSLIAAPLLLAGCATLPADPSATAAPGLVSAADPRAAEAGARMLRAGGSATDAAIATMLALTVVEPQSSGIGGGGFYVRSNAAGEVETLDGRETAPAAAGPEWFLGPDGKPLPFPQAVLSGRSIGVPGNVALAAEAHERHGKLAWAQLFEPAIVLARDGFAITPRLRAALAAAKNRASHDPVGRGLFYDFAGEPLPEGTLVRNPELAAKLERIARSGRENFYSGVQAQAMAARVAEYTPGEKDMTAADLATYQAKEREPVCGTYRVYLICGMGPPSSGATTVFAILKQLERFDLAALGPDSPVSWHLFAESQRLAYADREFYLADADFVAVPVAGLTEPGYLAQRGALIAADRRMAMVGPGIPGGVALNQADGLEPAENGTSHFVATDRVGNVVSYTSTIEGPFGSGLMFGGFYLNNELTDFSFVPAKEGRPVANRVEGGKRPRSSMAPTIVFDSARRPVLALGAAGGSTIPVQVAKALIGVLDWRLSAQQAIALPGLYAPEETMFVEPGSSLLSLRGELERLGHKLVERPMAFKANAAQLAGGRWVGAADPRSEGTSIGE